MRLVFQDKTFLGLQFLAPGIFASEPKLMKNLLQNEKKIKKPAFCHDSGLIKTLKISHIHFISGNSTSPAIIFAPGKIYA
jgi:hypothetical protein